MCTDIFDHCNFVLGSDSDKTNTRIEFKTRFVVSSHFIYTDEGGWAGLMYMLVLVMICKVITLLLYLNDR